MLSLSMIVRNEEERLKSCLDSVRNFVDEISILDTGSTDKTINIAKENGAKVETLEWPGDFAPARNKALTFVKGDWVLVLDADEQLLPGCIDKLRSYMLMEDVLLINLLRYEKGSKMNPYSSVSRLFRRHPDIYWSRPYHSIVDDSVQEILKREPHWRIVNCNIPAINHDGYSPEIIDNSDKAKRLRRDMINWLNKHPGDTYACAKLGALEVAEGRIEKGISILQEGLANLDSNHFNRLDCFELLFNLAIAVSKSSPIKAIEIYKEALSLEIDDRLSIAAYINLTLLLINLQQYQEATNWASQLNKNNPEMSISWHNLALAQKHNGQLLDSHNSYQMAIKLDPNSVDSFQNLAVLQLLLGRVQLARENFLIAISLLEKQNRLDEANTLRKQILGIVKLD